MYFKKGQSAGGAAALIAAILGLMLLYILFLPPGDRDTLLGNNSTAGGSVKGISQETRTLLSESPGTIFKSKQDEFEHKLNAFNLFSRSEDQIIKTVDGFSLDSKIKRKTFPLTIDQAKTSNLQLAFQVVKGNGNLIVRMNDFEVYSGEAKGFSSLNLDSAKAENVIEFSVPDSGFAFWQNNNYQITDIKITGTVKSTENLESRQVFIVSNDEYNAISTASILYYVGCRTGEAGTLSTYLNDQLLYSSVPDCGSPVKIQVDPQAIQKGSNTIKFNAERGSFLIDQLELKTKLKEAIEPIYYFDINGTEFNWIANGTFRPVMYLRFVDDSEEKRGEININGIKTFFDTRREGNYSRDIKQFIRQGNNYIKITPQTTLNIAEATIRLE